MTTIIPMKRDAFAHIKMNEGQQIQMKNDIIAFDKHLQQMENKVAHKEQGFFGPNSMTWKIYREPFIVIGGMRALLLQIAHPAVAKGVKLFSNFHEEYLHRAHRTFTSMATLYFGDTQQAMKVAQHLYQMHSMIRGTYEQQQNGVITQQPFVAKDPELLCWVLATLVDTSLLMYEKIYGPLSLEEKEQFFQESKITAKLMGIPEDKYPENLYQFYVYYHQMLRSDQLQVGDNALDLSNIIFHPPYIGHRLLVMLAKGSLPPRLARAYGLDQKRKSIKRFGRFLSFAKFISKITPRFLHHAPPYHQANYRILKSKSKPLFHLGGVYDWLGRVLNFPFLLK